MFINSRSAKWREYVSVFDMAALIKAWAVYKIEQIIKEIPSNGQDKIIDRQDIVRDKWSSDHNK